MSPILKPENVAGNGTRSPAPRGKRKTSARLIAGIQGGTYLEPSKTTVQEYLEKWLEHIKPNVAPRTYQRYHELALKNIAPLLGDIILSKLQPIQISGAYSRAVTIGRRDGRGGLSARTVQHMHRVLRAAMAQAVKWNLLLKNPCDMLEKKDRPKIERKPVAVIDAADTMSLLKSARGTRWFIPMLLGALCGIRRGEIIALCWKDVRFDAGQITISRSIEQTKNGCREKETKGSKCRTLAMPSLLIEELKAWRVQQAQDCYAWAFAKTARLALSPRAMAARSRRKALPIWFLGS